MQLKTVVIVAAVLTAASLVGCGHDHEMAVTPTAPTSNVQTLDTAQVLALAQKSSETTTPFVVNGGLLVLSDSSDTAEAISVNGM
jgi:hypothetical protein